MNCTLLVYSSSCCNFFPRDPNFQPLWRMISAPMAHVTDSQRRYSLFGACDFTENVTCASHLLSLMLGIRERGQSFFELFFRLYIRAYWGKLSSFWLRWRFWHRCSWPRSWRWHRWQRGWEHQTPTPPRYMIYPDIPPIFP